jgi:hypothetical protein
MRLALQRFFSRVSVKFADFPMPNDFTTKLDNCNQFQTTLLPHFKSLHPSTW